MKTNKKLKDVGSENGINEILNESENKEWKIIGGVKKWIRNCPNCKRLLSYTNESNLKRAIKNKVTCNVCSGKRRIFSIKTRDKIRNTNKQYCGNKHSQYGKPKSMETKLKISKTIGIYSKETLKKVRRQRGKFYDWLHGKTNEFDLYIGKTLEEFKRYIESLFDEGMTWENHGKSTWHIDHDRPLCSFDFTKDKEIKKAWHFSNLKPLWASENCSKGKKWTIQ